LSRESGRAGRLIIGIGNPSRGDDALGPLAIERLATMDLPDVELLTDYQLQVEYVLDLEGREEIIFIDARVAGDAPFAFVPIAAREDTSFTSHALSPAALMAAYERHFSRPPPPARVLAIRAYAFELGEAPGVEALTNLEAALAILVHHLAARG
jgi:hydrogenase maturation protease